MRHTWFVQNVVPVIHECSWFLTWHPVGSSGSRQVVLVVRLAIAWKDVYENKENETTQLLITALEKTVSILIELTCTQSNHIYMLCTTARYIGTISRVCFNNLPFHRGRLKLENYYSSTISDCTTNNFYSLRRFNRHRRPSSWTECSVVTAR